MDKGKSGLAIEPRRRLVCPLCDDVVSGNLGLHIRRVHGEESFRRAVLAAKEGGMPDAEIGARFNVSFNKLQQIITEAYGANISVLRRPKRIRRWEPPGFCEEVTTVWSFKQRGDWATHDGRYRGNWSPYIPRNVILKYSKPGDVVLDYFVGGGTTAVEAKLLGRRCIARDINPGAVGLTKENLRFSPPRRLFEEEDLTIYEPEVSVGDARDLSGIPDGSIDLICAHPPYAGIIKYSSGIEGDLSGLPVDRFLVEMGKVAKESMRVLKPGGKCAILLGDARREKHVVPIGFLTMRVFLDAGFSLRELVIKRQHNCKTTGFWYKRSIKYNFLLLAHEYLPIFEKPAGDMRSKPKSPEGYLMPYQAGVKRIQTSRGEALETTTVWIFPSERLEAEVRRNLMSRFAVPGSQWIEVALGRGQPDQKIEADKASVIYIAPPTQLASSREIAAYCSTVKKISAQAGQLLQEGGFLVVDTRDVRVDGSLTPMGMLVWERLQDQKELAIKEIVVVVPENEPKLLPAKNRNLRIIHRYLLIYKKRAGDD